VASLIHAGKQDVTIGSTALLAPTQEAPGRRGWITDERASRLRLVLLAADVLALLCSFVVVDLLRRTTVDGPPLLPEHLPVLALGIVAWVMLAAANDLYHLRSRRLEQHLTEESGAILRMTIAWSWALVVAAEVIPLPTVDVPLVAIFWITASTLLIALRTVVRVLARRRSWYTHRTLLVGPDRETEALARKLRRHPEYRIDVVGAVEVAAAAPPRHPGARRGKLRFEDVPELVDELGVQRVILASPPKTEGSAPRFHLARELAERGVRVDLLPAWFEMLGTRLSVWEIEGTSLLTVPYVRLGRTSRTVKRCFDVAVTTTLALAVLPLIVLCALAIKLDSRGPVLFRQRRIGRHGHPFELVKFRSMHAGADEDDVKDKLTDLNMHRAHGDPRMFKLRRDPRTTRVGAFLRRTSLDELPQLWNIWRGDMSLVGPRPLIEVEANQVEGVYRRRLELTPGLTGLWQVNGRSEVPFDAMVNLDYLYVTTWSLWGDTKILLKTIPAVLARRGAF
jgi:exopolysaccharide biosynthesis polyprenyl glycosylphosphotransferase